MTLRKRIRPLEVSKEFVLSKIMFFIDVQLWPTKPKINPEGWLSNFSRDEEIFAINLLNVFTFINESMVDSLFLSAFHGISVEIIRRANSAKDARNLWKEFLTNVIVTYVQGETPNPTDSGIKFARKARQVLNLSESQILDPKDAIQLISDKPEKPIVFVDDFVGSGDQMRTTWNRSHTLINGECISFSDICNSNVTRLIYCPLVCTNYGMNQIAQFCKGLHIHAVHQLTERDSLVNEDSVLWPDSLSSEANNFLFEISKRAGIVDNYKYGWEGFNKLGLALALHDSVPDATLPLYFWDKNGWIPLIRRT